MGLANLEFRDQLLVFLIGALGTHRGEVGALRWMDCDFENAVFYVRHSYYWHRGGHLKATETEASAKPLPMQPALKNALAEWKAQSPYNTAADFVFPSLHQKGRKPLDLSSVLKRKIKPAFAKLGVVGVGWHTFRHTVGTLLADMGEHQLTIRDYLRHSNFQRYQQVFASDVEDQASRPREVGRCDPAHGIIVREQINPDPVILHPRGRRSRGSSGRSQGNLLVWRAGFLIGRKWTQIADWVLVECLYLVEKASRDDETRTRNLLGDSAASIGFTTTYNNAGLPNYP